MVALIAFAMACGDDDGTGSDTGGQDTNGTDTNRMDTNGTDVNGMDTNPDDTGVDAPSGGDWERAAAHPCVTDEMVTLERLTDGTLLVGCGEDSAGDRGFFVSTDNGANWGPPSTTPPNYYSSSRVSDIWQDPADGYVYISTISDSVRVTRFEATGSSWMLEEVYEPGNTTSDVQNVGTTRRDGARGFIESLNGVEFVARFAGDSEFAPHNPWAGGARRQLLDMEVFDGRAYAAGSRINEVPTLYVEDTAATDFTWTSIPLVDGLAEFEGEMWAIDVDAGGIVLGGVNQDANTGQVFTADLNGANIQQSDLGSVFPDDATWIEGVCRDGQQVLAVGRFSINQDGIVLASTDGGQTWEDWSLDNTPSGTFPPAFDCLIEGGTAYVALGAGQLLMRDF